MPSKCKHAFEFFGTQIKIRYRHLLLSKIGLYGLALNCKCCWFETGNNPQHCHAPELYFVILKMSRDCATLRDPWRDKPIVIAFSTLYLSFR